jgi:hypothetical protein
VAGVLNWNVFGKVDEARARLGAPSAIEVNS